MSRRLSRAVARAASLLVPSERRAEWLEEWLAELEALEAARAEASSATTLPGRLAFAAGAIPHAFWTMTEGWTMDSVLHDLRYSVRVLRRAPMFTAVAALTLALGIGANASIFSLVNGLLYRTPTGLSEPDRLVQVARSYESAPRWDNFSWPALELIRREARTLSGVAGYAGRGFVLGRGAEVEQVFGQMATGNYFDVLGVRPQVGRLLQPGDDVRPGAHPVVVLSDGLWRRRFGADPRVVGSTIQLGAEPYTVVGVAPAGFAGVESIGTPPALWVPTMQDRGYRGELLFDLWGASWINLVGRLADGVSFEAARASMDVVSARLREADPVNEDILALLAQGVGLDPEERAQAETISLILLSIVGVVLLLTCANVANLSLARASGRRLEVGVRMALGAGRRRMVRQLVTEAMLVSLLATALALPIVLASGRFLPLVFPYTLSVPVGVDESVLLFLAGVGLVAGVLFGAAPAWATSRRDVTAALREGAASGAPQRTRLRDALIVGQLALSLGLVAAAALLGRSVLNARNAEPGFDPHGLVAAFVDLEPTGRYDQASGSAAFDRLLREAASIPGVTAATIASQAPIAGGHSRSTVVPSGRQDVDYEAEMVVVGPDYFGTLGIPLVEGRTLGGLADEPEPVVVVNEALASLFWPGESALDKRISGNGQDWRVVGVTRDVQMRSLREGARPAVYYPLAHLYRPGMVLHLRGAAGSPPAPSAIRSAVAIVDPELPVAAVRDLREALTASLEETRTIGYLVGAFALLALALAAVGLYGLVSYWTSQRVREMGIRLALGAQPGALVKLVAGRGIGITLVGVLAGLGVSYALGRALQGLLFGVGAADATTLGGAAVLLALTAGLAAWLPARRAARVDAAVSLREQR